MEVEATFCNDFEDAEHYRTDRIAIEEAIKSVERSNT